MILSLCIENFYSIAEKQEIDFSINKIAPNYPQFRVTSSGAKIPTVIGLFGANASGKTNVLRAIISTAFTAIQSFNFQENGLAFHFQPYRHSSWLEKPTKIAIEFESQLQPNLILLPFSRHIE